MARVPVIDRPQVRQNILPNAVRTDTASADAFGAGAARDLGNFAKSAFNLGGEIAEEFKLSDEKKDKALVRDSFNQARSEARTYMAEAYRKKGADAVEVYPEVEKNLNEIRRKYTEGFKSEDQKALFTSSYDGVMNGHLDRAISFQEKARADYEKVTLDAENQNAIEDAVASYTDPVEIAEAEATIEANTRFANKGVGPEVAAKLVEDAKHNLHSEIVNAVVNDSPEAGLKYLNDNWDKFNPKVRAGMKKQVQEKVDAFWVQSKAIELTTSGLSYEQQLAQVDKVKDPKQASALRKVVKDRNTEKKAVAELASKEKINNESDLIFKDPFGYQLNVAKFDRTEQDYLYALQQRLKKDKLAGKGVGSKSSTNPDTFMNLMSMPVDELRQEDLKKYVNDLSSSDFEEVFKRQRDGDKNTSQMQLLKTATGGMKDFNIKEEGEDASKRMTALISEFQNRVKTIPPQEQTEEKLREIIYKDLLAPVSTDTGWFDGLRDKTLYRFEVPYLDEQREKSLAYEQNVPEKLKDFQNTQYHKESERYYIDGDGIRDIYDKYGNYIKSYKKVAQ